MSNYKVSSCKSLKGEIVVPGDKSISHRSIMFGSLANGETSISGFLEGEDSLATLNAFKSMGVRIEGPSKGKVQIKGVGMNGLQPASQPLDLGNSGTSMRLMAGLLSSQNFESTLMGDKSLSGRPMNRVIKPLAEMGAKIESQNGKAPLVIHGNTNLFGIKYDMPMASAQVKSCLLLAGMYASGQTRITEPGITRDHTERMLSTFLYPIDVGGNSVSISGGGNLTSCELDIPADISSAAFFMVAASISENADLLLKNVGINPTRTGVIEILRLMGAKIELLNERKFGSEPVADIHVSSSQLHGVKIPENLVPLAIDEFPVIFVAAACAEGETVLTGAEELRVKESDRIQAMADGLIEIGIDAVATDDGLIINGGEIRGGVVESHDDHRIAMAFSVAGIRSKNEIVIKNINNVATSFPNFLPLAQEIGMHISIFDT